MKSDDDRILELEALHDELQKHLGGKGRKGESYIDARDAANLASAMVRAQAEITSIKSKRKTPDEPPPDPEVVEQAALELLRSRGWKCEHS